MPVCSVIIKAIKSNKLLINIINPLSKIIPTRYKKKVENCTVVLIFAKNVTLVTLMLFFELKSLNADIQNSLASMMPPINPI